MSRSTQKISNKSGLYANNTNKASIAPYHKLNTEQIEVAVTLVELGKQLKPSNIAKLLNVSEENINQHARRRKEKNA